MTDDPQHSLNIGAAVSSRDVDLWRREMADIRKNIADLEARHEQVAKKVDIAETLFRLLEKEPAPSQAERTRGKPLPAGSMIDIVHQCIRDAGRIAFPELREAVLKGPLGSRLQESDKGFHNGIGRLARRGDIVRHKGWLFSAEQYAAHMADVELGLVKDVPAPSKRPAPLADAILGVVAQTPGLSMNDLISKLSEQAEESGSVLTNVTSAYNTIARLVRVGKLRKDGDSLFLNQTAE